LIVGGILPQKILAHRTAKIAAPVLAGAAICLLGLPAGTAWAQTGSGQAGFVTDLRPQPAPAVLTEVRLIAESAIESRFLLRFAPRANDFAATKPDNRAGPNQAALGFALSSRGNSAVTPQGLKGLVRAIAFEQADSVLILRFGASAPVKAAAATLDPQTVEVTVSADDKAAGRPSAIPANGPLPQARDPGPGQDGYALVMLRYADVSEVVGLLTDGLTVKSNDVFTPREPGFGSTSLTGGGYNAPQAVNNADDVPLGQSVDSAIAIDRRLNAVWLKGSPERIARMKEQIALMDVPVDSVILETQLIELTETGSKALGVDFTNSSGQLGVVTAQSGAYITSGNLANSGGHLNAAGSQVGGHLTSAAVQAAIYAQISKGNGRIVSRPRIAAQSGGSAKIVTGDALPILTAITLSGVNGVSQQVQYVNVGVTLQIAPRVAADGNVTSHVFCVVSSVTGYSQGYPTISQREAETSATVRDGETFVIGGLSQESETSTDAKVPLLGDVPVLGRVFHNTNKSKAKTELFIVVTPHIIHRFAAGN
jgi:general secretion pathway protein D